MAAAAKRRLREEMGVGADLRHVGTFVYRAAVGQLVEHEVDHVFVGQFAGVPQPDPREVGAWRWIPLPNLEAELTRAPLQFSPWFAEALRTAIAGAPDAVRSVGVSR